MTAPKSSSRPMTPPRAPVACHWSRQPSKTCLAPTSISFAWVDLKRTKKKNVLPPSFIMVSEYVWSGNEKFVWHSRTIFHPFPIGTAVCFIPIGTASTGPAVQGSSGRAPVTLASRLYASPASEGPTSGCHEDVRMMSRKSQKIMTTLWKSCLYGTMLQICFKYL